MVHYKHNFTFYVIVDNDTNIVLLMLVLCFNHKQRNELALWIQKNSQKPAIQGYM